MKKLLLFAPVLGLLWSACSNDFEIAAPRKDIPVVYSIMSVSDTAQYVRVERAFIDPTASAYVVALEADSLYYPENAIAVYLERVSNGQRYPLTRVDGNLDGHIRESGTFATSPNWLYKVKTSQITGGLVKGQAYRLVIERADGNPNVTAETTVPDSLLLFRPEPSTTTPRRINLSGNNPVSVEWRSSVSAYIFDVYMNIRYREAALDGSSSVNKSIRWRAAKNVVRENTLIGGGFYRGKTTVSVSDFYNVLLQNIEPSTTLQRYFTGIDIQIEGAGPEIANFQESAAVNAGLTGAEVNTSYTNFSEGYGIFTIKKNWTITNFQMPIEAVDSLNVNPVRRMLNFKG